MDPEKLGRAGYEAYGKSTGNKNYQGLEMPKWENLTPAIQQAWRAAAMAIVLTNTPVSELPVSTGHNCSDPHLADHIEG